MILPASLRRLPPIRGDQPTGLGGRPPAPLKRRILRVAQGALYRSRALDRLPARGGATIFMYHSVASPDIARFVDSPMTPDGFERQIRFLSEHRRPMGVSDLAQRIGNGVDPEPGTVVVTFDDGYLDNLRVAAPILRRYGVAAMIYLATAYVDQGETQWADRLHTAFTTRTGRYCRLPAANASEVPAAGNLAGAAGGNTAASGAGPSSAQEFDLTDPDQARAAYVACQTRLLAATFEERAALLAQLDDDLQGAAAPRLTLGWDDVRELAERYPEIEIGVHTAHHVDLVAAGPETARLELQRSIDDVERATGVRPRHFSFPYGRHDPATRRLVAEAGLETAMADTAYRQTVAASDPHYLTRIDAGMSFTQFRFRTHPSFGSLPPQLAKGH